jgi:N-acetylneuraminic acid mutarotase
MAPGRLTLNAGRRYDASSWIDTAGNLWMFGGYGYDGQETSGSLNDLWKFNPSTNAWTWVSGSTANGVSGVYGTKGVASVNNFPGARQEAATWIDSGGNLWLMGGYGSYVGPFRTPERPLAI